ncbi:MAG: hypothetical protein PWQ96_1157 [Clostridia bacterium]|jgi:uncharacterized membrane protein YheB (UPF0754 family)|nr:hypothetical protein [Clostridia bacterium]
MFFDINLAELKTRGASFMEKQLLTLPFIGALIGWFTNRLAIKLIFRPYKPIRIPLTRYSFQGLIPKRHDEIAVTVGSLIEEQLLSIDDVVNLLNNKEAKQKLVSYLIPTLKQNFKNKLPAFLPYTIKENAANLFEEVLKRETPSMVGKITSELANNIKDEIKFGPIIQEKIKSFDLESLERLVLRVTSKELKHIEILGAVLGFLIGILQVFVMTYII